MPIPPADHPLWKVLQSSVAVIGLSVMVLHGMDGGHTVGAVDVEDGASLIGIGAAAKLLYSAIKN